MLKKIFLISNPLLREIYYNKLKSFGLKIPIFKLITEISSKEISAKQKKEDEQFIMKIISSDIDVNIADYHC